MGDTSDTIVLPPPAVTGGHGLKQLLHQRRSVRAFTPSPLTLADLGQLLWAAQGITGRGGLRSAPSAGALYPLELYVAAGRVVGLAPDVYRYDPKDRSLERTGGGDVRKALARAAVHQGWVGSAPAVVVFAAAYARTEHKYGARAERYVQIEAGHAAENLFLQAEDLALGTVPVGAFDDDEVARVLGLPAPLTPLLLMPVGHPAAVGR